MSLSTVADGSRPNDARHRSDQRPPDTPRCTLNAEGGFEFKRRDRFLARYGMPILGLILALLVPLMVPRGRIELGADRLQGLVGSYTGHGNWAISATYSGAETVSMSMAGGSQISGAVGATIGNRVYNVTSGSYALSMLNDQLPFMNMDGGCSMRLDNAINMGFSTTTPGAATLKLTSSKAKVRFGLQWMPENDDIKLDPAPKQVMVFYRRIISANVAASAHTASDYSRANAVPTVDGLAANATASNPDKKTDSQTVQDTGPTMLQEKLPVTNGGASRTFSIDSSFNISQSIGANSNGVASANGFNRIDFCVAGFDFGRFNEPDDELSGNHRATTPDPTLTRWLPLAFAPQINSQPFRFTNAAALPAPWGNINCVYSLALVQEPSTPNFDIDSFALFTQPTFNPDGTFNGILGPFLPVSGGFQPQYSILDANGDRLMFDARFQPYGDVHSTLTNLGGGLFQLSNAGPPNAIGSSGTYVYTFQAVDPASTRLFAHLTSLQDDLGNIQRLTWNGPSSLIVSDSSSGRRMIFNAGVGGYFGSVDAPESDGVTPHTHTTLTFDTTGHLTQQNVYAGNSQTVLNTREFAYGGPNNDSITAQHSGILESAFTYTSNPQSVDAFGNQIPRLSSVTEGAPGDTSTSDDGGSVAGTYNLTFGPTQYGYNWWGRSAHTNTLTDARGNLFTTRTELGNDIYGSIIGHIFSGPAYHGVVSANQTHLVYSPSMAEPQSIYVYDQLANLSQNNPPWQVQFDLFGNPTSLTDPLNRVWEFGYTEDGRHLASVTDPTLVSTTLSYGERNNPVNRLTTITTPEAGPVQIDYNSFGQPTSVSLLGNGDIGQTVHVSYAPVTGDMAGLTNPLGDQFRILDHDALGDPTSIVSYPDTGNPATSTTPLAAHLVWDSAQRLSSVTFPNGLQAVNTWVNGMLTNVRLQAPGSTGSPLAQNVYTFDTRGRVSRVQDAVGLCAQYQYDKNSNLTRIIDGQGNVTRIGYGDVNEPIALTWPDGNQATVNYDAAGRVQSSTDELGTLTTYEYDLSHRLTNIDWATIPTENVHFVYDDAGRLASVADKSGKRSYGYDLAGRLQTLTIIYNGLPVGSNTFTFGYQYNGDGSIATLSTPVGTRQYSYNLAGRLIRITHSIGINIDVDYDHAGRLISRTIATKGHTLTTRTIYGVSGLPNDSSASPFYLRQLNYAWDSSPLSSYTLTHDLLGRILQQDHTTSRGTFSNQSTEKFAYDYRGRLTNENQAIQDSSSGNQHLNSSYAYDNANNVQPVSGGWVINANNQLVNAPFTPPNPGLSGLTGFAYDVAGNTTFATGFILGWDAWRHLTNIGSNIIYTYDSAGRRLSKTVNGQTTWFLYVGKTLLAEMDNNGTFTRIYVNEGNGPLADAINGQIRLYVHDGLGNTRTILDANTGELLWQGAWSAWGTSIATLNRQGKSLVTPTPFGYKGQFGQYTDAESGLLYLSARYYCPAIGRFLNRDPIAHSGGINLYTYCGGDPVNIADPSGLDGLQFETPTTVSTSSLPSVTPATSELAGAVESTAGQQATGTLLQTETALEASSTVGMEDAVLTSTLSTSAEMVALGLGGTLGIVGIGAGHQLGVEIADYQAACQAVEEELINPVHVATNPTLGSRLSQSLNRCRPQCFAAGTPVQTVYRTPKGGWQSCTIPIEHVRAGDFVLARNERNGNITPKRVLGTSKEQTDFLIGVDLLDPRTGRVQETLQATREHLFYKQYQGFQPIGTFHIGDCLISRNGTPLTIGKLHYRRSHTSYPVFNLLIDDDHTFFVGHTQGGVWVHNNNGGGLGSQRTRDLDGYLAQWFMLQGWHHAAGGGLPQAWVYNYCNSVPGQKGIPKGSMRPDLIFRRNGVTLFVETVDVTADGKPTKAALDKLEQLRKLNPNAVTILWPKFH